LSVVAVHLIEKPFHWFTHTSGRRRPALRSAGVIVILPLLVGSATAQTSSYIDDHQDAAWEEVSSADLAELGPNTPAGVTPPVPNGVLPNSWINSYDLGVLGPCNVY